MASSLNIVILYYMYIVFYFRKFFFFMEGIEEFDISLCKVYAIIIDM